MMASLKGNRILVTGGAGFIGSHLADRLVKEGSEVVVYDNLSTGDKRFLSYSLDKVDFIKGDLLDKPSLNKAMKGIGFVFHMAANADVKDNLNEPLKCVDQNIIATSNVLESMRINDVKGIAFASTGSVYGESSVHPTPENAEFPVQTSIYGASKLAGEGLLQAYSEGYGFNAFIFRFVSVLGERYTHGCVIDFYKKLLKNPNELEILGDGKQKKSYLYVKDCVSAMFKAIENSKKRLNMLNLGHDDYIQVDSIAKIVCEELDLNNVSFKYTGGKRGWIGDIPYIHLDTSKIKSFGWSPSISIEDSVNITINWLKENKWTLERR